jgi:hypothetical protein
MLAVVGLALPVGLALAVYLTSAGTIAATPASLPPSAVTIAQPSAAAKAQMNGQTKKAESKKPQSSRTGTTSVDDNGGTTSTDDHGGNSGPGGGDDSSGSGSGSSGSSGSGSSDDD